MKIEKLTPLQEEQLIAFREKWRNIGLSTEPADRNRAAIAIKALYAEAGKTEPQVWFFDSPLSCVLVANIFPEISKCLKSANLRDNLGANLGDNLVANLRDNLRANLWDNLWDNLVANLRDNLGDNLKGNQLKNYNCFWGQHDSFWIAFYLFPAIHLAVKFKTDQDEKRLNLWAEIAQSCNWFYPFENFVLVSNRPASVCFDAERRLHNESAPSVLFRDGWASFNWHGVRVPKTVITNPESITVKDIEKEPNAEVRRVMIERYGQSRYLSDSGSTCVSKDQYGELYRKEIANDEPLVMVKVRNSTPELDGSIKDYFLRVPPEIQTAWQAVAWTFGITEKPHEYKPEIET